MFYGIHCVANRRDCLSSGEMGRNKMPDAPRVLIVDDHPLFRDALETALECAFPSGAEATHASNLSGALDILRSHPVDLILLDLMMPRMDGFTFLERVREDARHKNIPVVVLTAKTLDEQERELLEASTERVFGKDTMGTGELLSELIHVLKQQDHEGKKGAT